MDDDTDDRDSTPLRPRLRPSDVLTGVAVGAVVAVAAIVVLVAVFRREATAELGLDALNGAQERWRQNGPADYSLDVQVTGRQPGQYHVEVRAGEPFEVRRNGVVANRRTWQYWTVPGLFEVIEHDIDCSEDPTRGFGARPGSKAVLRARFDPVRGYPKRFERLILGEPQLDMIWEITRFETPAESAP